MNHERLKNCGNPDCISCVVCDCYVCARCHLLEGGLTSECPGVDSFADHADKVYQGEEDFVGGAWVTGACSPHSPKRWGMK